MHSGPVPCPQRLQKAATFTIRFKQHLGKITQGLDCGGVRIRAPGAEIDDAATSLIWPGMREPCGMLEQSVMDVQGYRADNQPHKQQHACLWISQERQTPLAVTLRLAFVIFLVCLGLVVASWPEAVLLAKGRQVHGCQVFKGSPHFVFQRRRDESEKTRLEGRLTKSGVHLRPLILRGRNNTFHDNPCDTD